MNAPTGDGIPHGPLEGIRVIDLAQQAPGPGACMYLADLGADVIKVEPRDGDHFRSMGTTAFWGNDSRNFTTLNRNKRGITVDIRTPEGREIAHRLAKDADVAVVNFRQSVAARLHLDYDTLSRINPRLVYAAVSAYGNKGPFADRGGYDRILQGLAGVMQRRTPDGAPMTAGIYAAISATPMLLAYGVMAALWAREKTGVGQKVEASLLHTWLALQLTALTRAQDDPDPGAERVDGGFGVYQCADGKWINIAPNNDRQFIRMCRALALDDVLEDPRFTDHAQRPQLRREIHSKIAEIMKRGGSRECLEQLYEADVPAGPILSREEVFEEPQVVENEMLVNVLHPRVGRTRMVAPALRFSATPAAVRHAAPQLGEHTAEVLEQLGYTPEEIARLRTQEVI